MSAETRAKGSGAGRRARAGLRKPTSTAAGKAFLEGIAQAKAEGAYKGGQRRFDRETVRAMFVAGQGPAAIAKALRCSWMQVYRVLGEGTSSGA